MNVFKMDEFIKIAIKDEETGIAFYNALSESTNNEIMKESFAKMAEQEKNHKENFQKMLGKVPESHLFEEYAGQYESYVSAMLESRAFSSPEKAAEEAKKMGSGLKAVETALKMEKDTLLFYLDMKDFIPATHKKYVEEIINEERGHIRDLTELKSQLD